MSAWECWKSACCLVSRFFLATDITALSSALAAFQRETSSARHASAAFCATGLSVHDSISGRRSFAERHAAEIRFIEVVCSDAALHEQRLAARAERLAAASLPESFAVEQSLDEWEDWTGPSGAIARITLDSVEPLGVNVERALAFLQR